MGTEPARVRIPRGNEKIGVVAQRYGGNRMEVQCTDGKTRNCRVPGRFKRSLWLRPRDVILVQVWPDDDEKGDIIFKYNPGAVNQLRKRGLLKESGGAF
jgi:translation initiation factor 1A